MAIIMRYAVMALHGVIRNPKGATRRGGGQPCGQTGKLDGRMAAWAGWWLSEWGAGWMGDWELEWVGGGVVGWMGGRVAG